MSEHHGPTSTCACVSRRESLRAAGLTGVAVVGAGTLAACGAEDDPAGAVESAGGAASSAASSGASAAASAAGSALKAADVPVGGGRVVDSLKVVVTQPTEGDFKAFSAVCPHQGCTVSKVENNVISCACHGSTFDATTGDVTNGPATRGLDPKQVSLNGDGLNVG